MRLLVTADLHYNHSRSRPLAEALIDEMNGIAADVLLVVGDTAVADGDSLERCLGRFKFSGPKLLVAGNHELWTSRADSYDLFKNELPARVAAMGWHWLETTPFWWEDIAVVGTVGWYDYGFAEPGLNIPHRFYASKVSPGAANRLTEFAHLLDSTTEPATAEMLEIVARWNDGRHVKLHRSDEAFVDELTDKLAKHLTEVQSARAVVAAIHHLPFAELLPPRHGGQWDFVKAYLGSPRLGAVLQKYPNVRYALCGHSHFRAQAAVGIIQALNIGSGYRAKRFELLNTP